MRRHTSAVGATAIAAAIVPSCGLGIEPARAPITLRARR